jgi:hypothetical protein
MRLCEGSLGWLGNLKAARANESVWKVCRSLVLVALGWTGWSDNAARRCREILAMVANADKGCLTSSNKNIVSKLLI